MHSEQGATFLRERAEQVEDPLRSQLLQAAEAWAAWPTAWTVPQRQEKLSSTIGRIRTRRPRRTPAGPRLDIRRREIEVLLRTPGSRMRPSSGRWKGSWRRSIERCCSAVAVDEPEASARVSFVVVVAVVT